METRLFKKGIVIALIGMAALTACNNSTKKQATQPEPSAPAQQTLSLKGTLVIGHEVRSFTAEGDSIEYWIVDKSGKLEKQYDELTKGVKNGTPVYAELEVTDMGKSDEGFAAEYAGVYHVVKIDTLKLP